MIIYRKATPSDANDLARIRSVFSAEAGGLGPADERIIALERANLAYFTSALADGSFIAWLAVNRGETDGSDGEIIATSGLSFSVAPPTLSCPDGKTAYIMSRFV